MAAVLQMSDVTSVWSLEAVVSATDVVCLGGLAINKQHWLS